MSESDSGVQPAAPTPPQPTEPPHWFNEQRREVAAWVVQVVLGILGFLLIAQYNAIQEDIKDLQKQVAEIRLAQERQAGENLRDDVRAVEDALRELERRLLWRNSGNGWLQPAPADPSTQPR